MVVRAEGEEGRKVGEATEAARGVVERAVEGTGVAAQVERGVVERAVESEWVEWTAEVKVVVRAVVERGSRF